MQEVFIMIGASGMGKTTTIGKIVDYYSIQDDEVVICSADHFFEKDDKYNFDGTKLHLAHGSCQKKFKKAIEADTPYVFVDNTNIMREHMMFYVDFALKRGYRVRIVDLFDIYPDAINCAEIFFQRNAHNVPLKSIKNMIEDYIPLTDAECAEMGIEKFNLKVL